MRRQPKPTRPKPARPTPEASRRGPKETPAPPGEVRRLNPSLRIVGIGASAGGLEALAIFLAKVPAKSGLAFVIVQHLDPTHKGVMVELLQRSTAMPVVQVKDHLRVKPDCVYLIPPNKDMSILHGVLHLLDPVAPRGLRLPIDFFLRSLADDQREHSIGVILSGMGSDGTLGLRAIKERAGVVLVQTPSSAKFDSMPRSAIEAGLADIVAPAEALPGKILAYLQHVPRLAESVLATEEHAQNALAKVIILLRSRTGHDFSQYKKTTVYRRIERRMSIHQIGKISAYVRFLQENPQEVDLLFHELLIGVTRFFRDPAAWDVLKGKALPALLSRATSGQALRAWVPGCSTGEEAYSLAILFKEALAARRPTRSSTNITLQVFATDLDEHAIAIAREGVFPPNLTADVSTERLSRFFTPAERGYQVTKSVREMVIFAPQDIIMDPPFTRLDLLSCRNLLIYLTPELQRHLLSLFHYSINPGGILFLGSSETVGAASDLFAPLGSTARVFQRIHAASQPHPAGFPARSVAPPPAAPPEPPKPVTSLQALADRLLLSTYAPAAVLTNDKGDILYISGRTGKYLEPAAGKANWNIMAMTREELRDELPGAFRATLSRQEAVTLRNVVIRADGGAQLVDVTLQALRDPELLRGMVMVVFTDVATHSETGATAKARPAPARRVAELERGLVRARQEMEMIREEMQSSQEELKSANEELQSTNEELQSTNEELTTSREEMQSMNEELQTINHELEAKVEELSRTNDDMKNLLDSTDIATLFLDNALRVRRFTVQTTKITRLIAADVGRPISDIASDPLYRELSDDVREVLRTLMSVEKQISTEDGRWFAVRILPYRTLQNMIDGVVITFANITVSKTLEAELRAKEARLRELVEARPGRG